jgi:hypothetical protein
MAKQVRHNKPEIARSQHTFDSDEHGDTSHRDREARVLSGNLRAAALVSSGMADATTRPAPHVLRFEPSHGHVMHGCVDTRRAQSYTSWRYSNRTRLSAKRLRQI